MLRFALLGLFLPLVALAQPGGRGPAMPEVRGLVKVVDAVKNTITVATGGDRVNPPEEKTFALAQDVEVAFGAPLGRTGVFKAAKLGDVTAGVQVLLSLTADGKTVTSILAEGPVVRGLLKSVDVNKGTITIATAPGRGGEGEEKVISVAKGAEIGVDDGRGRRFSVKQAKLADLGGGGHVTAWLALDGKEAQAILAEGATTFGTVKSVAKDKLTLITGAGRGGQPGEERTFTLPADAPVLLDDGKGRRLSVKEGLAADIPTGASAMLRLTPDGSAVALVRIEGAVVSGMVKGVDATKGTITYALPVGRNENAEEKTLPVATDARILIEGTETKLGDLKIPETGLPASLRLTLDGKSVQGLMTFPGR